MRAHLNTASSVGLPDARQTLIKRSEFSRRLPRQWGAGALASLTEAGKTGLTEPREEVTSYDLTTVHQHL